MSRSGSRRLRVRRKRRLNPLQRLLHLPGALLARLDGHEALKIGEAHEESSRPTRSQEPPHRYRGRRHHRRPQPLGLLGRVVLLPLMETLETAASLTAPIWRNPALSVPAGLAGVWLAWPLLAPHLLGLIGMGGSAASGPRPEVISVFVEDPTRSIWALDLWKNKPGAFLVMQGRPSSQIANVTYLRSQGVWPADTTRLIRLDPGCDTVGQVAALARFLEQQPRAGQLTMVTSNAHLPRTLAIARTVIGPMGWKVDGLPVVTQDNRPESPLRLVRDQLRAQMLRFTGISGSRDDSTCD